MSIIESLKSLEEESISRRIPILGAEKGQWLLERVQQLQPKRVLEFGTANGYSGIILASEGAALTTLEIDKKIAEEAEENFSTFNVNAEVIVGDALVSLKNIEGPFDLIFIDFAKKKYVKVLEQSITLLREEGYLIADNISMANCQDFKEAVLSDKRLKTEIIGIKDGLSFSVKSAE